MNDQPETQNPVALATERLEAAVDRLAYVLDRMAADPSGPTLPDGEHIPREAVAALAERLDATLAQLRQALHEHDIDEEG